MHAEDGTDRNGLIPSRKSNRADWGVMVTFAFDSGQDVVIAIARRSRTARLLDWWSREAVKQLGWSRPRITSLISGR